MLGGLEAVRRRRQVLGRGCERSRRAQTAVRAHGRAAMPRKLHPTARALGFCSPCHTTSRSSLPQLSDPAGSIGQSRRGYSSAVAHLVSAPCVRAPSKDTRGLYSSGRLSRNTPHLQRSARSTPSRRQKPQQGPSGGACHVHPPRTRAPHPPVPPRGAAPLVKADDAILACG